MSQTTNTLKGQCIAEFLGTGLIIFFGAGCVAALKLAGAAFGQWEICIIWVLAFPWPPTSPQAFRART